MPLPTSKTGEITADEFFDHARTINDLETAVGALEAAPSGGAVQDTDLGDLTGAATVNLQSLAGVVRGRLTGNATLTFSNPPVNGSAVTLVLTQDGTGGRTVTLPRSFRTPGGTDLVIDTNPGKISTIELLFTAAGTFADVSGTNYLDTMFKSALLGLSPVHMYDLGATGATVPDLGSGGAAATWNGTPAHGAAGMLPSDPDDRSTTFSGDDYALLGSGGRIVPDAGTSAWSVVILHRGAGGADQVLYGEGSTTDLDPIMYVGSSVVDATNTTDAAARARTRVFWRNNDATPRVLCDTTTLGVTHEAGTPHLIVVSYTPGTLRIYIDGTQDRSIAVTTGGIWDTSQAALGALPRATLSKYLIGDASIIATFNKALTGDEINMLQGRRA